MLTLGQAAKAAGVSKTTISKAVAKGRLSAGRSDTGAYQIDPAELFRVYPAASQADGEGGQDKTPGSPAQVTPDVLIENATLKAEIEGLRSMVQQLREQSDDLKEQRDNWADQAKATQRLLADMRPARRGWFWLGKAS